MKRLILCISMGLVCMGLSACDGTGFDPAMVEQTTQAIENASEAIGQFTETIDQASETIDQMSGSFEEIEKYTDQITASMQQGVDSTNAFMEWYKNDAIPENPWINPPITEEEVKEAIRAGQEEVLAYIEQNVDKNSTYDALSEEDIDFFTDYFSDESINGFLLSTYEKPEDCDAYEALSRYGAIIKKVKESEGEEAEGKISRDDADALLESVLGIDSERLNKPLDYKTVKDKDYLYISEIKDCEKLVCTRGFYYNNLYVAMMKPEEAEAPFAVVVLSGDGDGSYKICANYFSDDLGDIDWNGSFIFYLYDKMLNSDLKAVLSIPGKAGDIALGEAADLVGDLKGKEIDKVLELVSGKKDKVKTYIQEFEGYDVYYSDIDPEAAGEFIVSQIDVRAGDFKTAEGIGIGTGIEKIKETYGDGIEAMMSGGRKQLMYEMGKYNMLFIIDKAGKVSEMSIFLAGGVTVQ